MRDTVSRWLGDLLVQELGVPREEVSAGAPFEEVGVELSDLFELVETIERRTGISIPDAAVRRLHTIGDLDRALEAARGSQSPPPPA